MIVKFNPSGTHTHKGFLKVRVDLYPDIGDKTYQKYHVQVPVIPPGGYEGALDAEGSPVDQTDYNNWIDSLPKIWHLGSRLGHFIRIEETSTEADLIGYLEKIFIPTVIKTLDDISGLPNSVHLVSALMRDKAALTTKKAVTTDIESLIISTNSRFANLALGRAYGSRGLHIEPQSIDIGSPAINRSLLTGTSIPYVDKNNLANATGSLDTVAIYKATSNMQDLIVATFSEGASNVLTSRDQENIGFADVAAYHEFTGLDLDVETNDAIGAHYNTSQAHIRRDNFGVGYWYKSGGTSMPVTNVTFTFLADRSISVYGTGTESVVGGHPYISRVQGVQGMRSWGGF